MSEAARVPATESRWIAIHSAPVWDVLALKERLESQGIPTQLPDWNASLFEMGVDLDDVSAMLCVPVDHVPKALEELAKHAEERREAAKAVATNVDREREVRRIEAIGVRMRFASLSVVLVPWALAHAEEYFRATRELCWRPKEHAWNVTGFAVGIAMALFAASVVAVSISR